MEHHTSLLSVMIVVSVAFLIPIVLHRFKLSVIPVVVAEIIAGIIIGKSGFNIIHTDQWLELLSMFGFIYLMFLSGLEIDFSNFKTSKKKNQKINVVKYSVIVFLLIFIVSFVLSYILVLIGFINEPFLMTLIISTISLGVVVPVLKERGMMETELGQLLLLVSVLADFVTMILLAVYISMKSEGGGLSLFILVMFALVFVVYRIASRFATGKFFEVLKKGTTQIGTRGVFALILFFVVFSEKIGVESILGAFLAGVIVSLISPKKEFVHQLDSFGYGFLIPIFFVMVGVNIDLISIFNDWKMVLMIPVILIMLYISKLVPILTIKKWYSWKEVIGSGVLITSTLSLVIAAVTVSQKIGVMTQEVGNLLIVVAVLSCLISPIIFGKLDRKSEGARNKKVSIIGVNRITLPLSLDCEKEGNQVMVYGTKEKKIELDKKDNEGHLFPIEEMNEITIEELEKRNSFDCDIVIIGTSKDDKNIKIAKEAKEFGVKQIIVRVENPTLHEGMIDEGYDVFSTLDSTRVLVRTLINSPSIVHMMKDKSSSFREIEIKSSKYNGVELRKIPFLGDVLIVQIYRNNETIIPHGDTKLKTGDKIVVSGSKEHIKQMRIELK